MRGESERKRGRRKKGLKRTGLIDRERESEIGGLTQTETEKDRQTEHSVFFLKKLGRGGGETKSREHISPPSHNYM